MGCKEGPRVTSALTTLIHITKFPHHLTKKPQGLFLFWRVIGYKGRIANCWIWVRFGVNLANGFIGDQK